MRLTRDVDTGKWRARAEGGNLDKIQKNSSFSSGDLLFVASRGVPCTTSRPSALQNRTESSGYGKGRLGKGIGGRASEGALSRTRREQMVQGGGNCTISLRTLPNVPF